MHLESFNFHSIHVGLGIKKILKISYTDARKLKGRLVSRDCLQQGRSKLFIAGQAKFTLSTIQLNALAAANFTTTYILLVIL